MVAHSDILKHRPSGQKALLEDNGNVLKKLLIIDLSDVHAANPDTTSFHIIEAGDQLYQGRLSCAGFSQKCNPFPIGDMQAAMLQHFFFFAVGKRNIRNRYVRILRERPPPP